MRNVGKRKEKLMLKIIAWEDKFLKKGFKIPRIKNFHRFTTKELTGLISRMATMFRDLANQD